ncbi:C-C motif chemokine 4 homolog [Pygocentrus nattereri]|uniref:C-C motif chemokine 4 homolog n=1 Tax=Pygocentrus nattereri TaxID=42514 RepID=UPI001891B07D|nr:C-C motif chemokine 4 homolog [Pygocentrus nattereri]
MIVHPRSLLLGLLVILYLQSGAVGQNGNAPKECCFSFYTRPIPVADITQYEETRRDCPRAGVIFTTKRGVHVCVDPGFRWVKRAMDIIDRRFVEGSS